MLDKRSAILALVAFAAAALPVAQALTYAEVRALYPGLYGQYAGLYGYGYGYGDNNLTVNPNNNSVITQLQRALSGTTPGYGFAPVATAVLVILALAQLFV